MLEDLRDAVRAGALDRVSALLASGQDPNRTDEMGDTCAHTAVEEAPEDRVLPLLARLVEAGADLRRCNRYKRTVLHMALRERRPDVVTYLLALGADAHGQAASETPLHVAVRSGNINLVTLVLEAGANPNLANQRGEVPAVTAVRAGATDILELLLKHGADHTATAGGHSLLMLAIGKADIATFERLIAAGADLAAPDTLMVACGYTFAEDSFTDQVSATLIRAGGADAVRARRTDGWTPLQLAALHGHCLTVGRLLDAGADVNATDSDGSTALHCACRKGNLDIVERLLGAGADANRVDRSGSDAIQEAQEASHSAVVARLRDAGASSQHLQPSALDRERTARASALAACTPEARQTIETTYEWILSQCTAAAHELTPSDLQGDAPFTAWSWSVDTLTLQLSNATPELTTALNAYATQAGHGSSASAFTHFERVYFEILRALVDPGRHRSSYLLKSAPALGSAD